MKDQITRLCGWLTELFSVTVESVAGQTGFVQRARGVEGAAFVRTLVWGWIADKHCTIADFAERLDVTPSAVQQRLTSRGVDLFRILLEHACTFFMAAQPLDTKLTKRFSGIYVEDCTSIPLMESLAPQFPGCGGAEVGQGAAGFKALVRMEVTTGALSVLRWDCGRQHDLNLSRQAGGVPPGSLYLADLGFWCPARLNAFTQQGVFWISRVPTGTTLAVSDSRGHQPRERLAAFLARQRSDRVDQWVRLGEQGYAFRLVARRCPSAVANTKKRKLRKKSKKRGRTPSREQLALCEWLVLVTCLPPEQFSAEELWTLYRVRWQIELVFKRWKSELGLGHSRARTNGHRQLIELYAKLLGCLVTHWCGLLWVGLLTRLSWHQILKRIQRSLGRWLDLWDPSQPTSMHASAQTLLEQLLHKLQRLKPRSPRTKKPGTMDLLENPTLAFN